MAERHLVAQARRNGGLGTVFFTCRLLLAVNLSDDDA
jgi:hypothetical protein